MVTQNVVFEEPESVKVRARKLIEREPGELSRRLMRWGLVRSVTQAKIFITTLIIAIFLTGTYFLEAAMSGPDIPPRPPSPEYNAYVQERFGS